MTLADLYTHGDREHTALRMVPCTAETLSDKHFADQDTEVELPAWLAHYEALGVPLVLWRREDDPDNDWKGPRETGWPTKEYHAADYREGLQVGAKLGMEIQPGRYLADADLDWATAIPFFRRFVPQPDFAFGRTSKPNSHAFFTTSCPVTLMEFDDIDGFHLGELRGTKKDGTVGLQTVIPPSLHRESGEVLTFTMGYRIPHDDTMPARVIAYMAGSLLGRHWPKNGTDTNQHKTAAYAAAFFCQRGVDSTLIPLIIEVAATLGGDDDISDRVRYATDTVTKFTEGEKKLAGGPHLAQEVGEAVVVRLREWLPDPPLVVEDLPAFLKRVQQTPAPGWHIAGLIPDEGITLWHGQPRDFKTMCALEVALALAGGRAAFASERFRVTRAVPVAFFSEEDPERLVAARLHWLTVKTGVPTAFYPFIRKSLSFDNADDREFILRVVRETKVEVCFFDPVRSYTGLSDKGPADLRPVTVFLRRLQNETDAKTLSLVHHDTKPPAVTTNGTPRSRSQQASGGGIFSISDCPVSFTKLAWNKVAVIPEDYKLSGDPTPFEVTFETDERQGEDGPRFGSYVRPVAVSKIEQDILEGEAAKRILEVLHTHLGRWYTTEEVREVVALKTGNVGMVLKKLLDEGRVLFCTKLDAKALGHSANAKLWAGVLG